MESSIAVFLMRQLACEQLPTSRSDGAGTVYDVSLLCLCDGFCHLEAVCTHCVCVFAAVSFRWRPSGRGNSATSDA